MVGWDCLIITIYSGVFFFIKNGLLSAPLKGVIQMLLKPFGAFTKEKKPNESRLFVFGLKVTLTK